MFPKKFLKKIFFFVFAKKNWEVKIASTDPTLPLRTKSRRAAAIVARMVRE